MPRFAANLSMMFNELPFLDRFAAARKAGFEGVEVQNYHITEAEGTRSREIAEKMAGARFATEAGRRLAADRIAFAALFARKLAEEAVEFENAKPSG